ncbi:MAG: 50S ribosomal protein L25, partial [Minisyncoccia bacterium]
KNVNEIEVEALPQDLPHNIPVDVSKLETIDSKILIKDLKISEKVKILAAPDTVVAAVVEPKEEEVVAAPSIEEVKIETEEKKAERIQSKEKSDEKSE